MTLKERDTTWRKKAMELDLLLSNRAFDSLWVLEERLVAGLCALE